MESEAKDEESLDPLPEVGLLRETSSRCIKASTKASTIPERRPWIQLWLLASLMCGRDLLYAVEVVLVAPIMLQLGMAEDTFSYIWFCSPTLGLLLGPVIGSWSDRCGLKWGRRRPYILSFVVGTVVGLTLLIFSKDIAMVTSLSESEQLTLRIVLGVVGTQSMDFCLDQLETPFRAYTLDVCSPFDQQRAFTIQTLVMGFGGALGFIVDGIDWESIFASEIPGFQIKVVYVFAVVIYLTTAVMTLSSIKEVQWKKRSRKQIKSNGKVFSSKSAGCQATKSISDSHVIPSIKICRTNSLKRKQIESCKHGRSVDGRCQGTSCDLGSSNALAIKKNNASDYSAASTAQNVLLDPEEDQFEKFLPNGAESKYEEKVDLEQQGRDFVFPSHTLNSLALFPRISMCKSVFLTMSCPEGLNDPSSSSATTSSWTTDDESSSDEEDDESAKTDQGEDLLQSSMPNLPTSGEAAPATFLEILKNKFLEFSSMPQVSNTGSSVDNDIYDNLEELAVTKYNCSPHAVQNFLSVDHGQKTDMVHTSDMPENMPELISPMKHRVIFQENLTEIKKSEENDNNNYLNENGRGGAVRSLKFHPDDVAPANAVTHEEKRVRKRKKKKKHGKGEIAEGDAKPVSMRMLWLSIITMPSQLRYLCFSMLFSFIGIEVMILWYTNIFGAVVYGGNPTAPANSTELKLYNDGVQMGCWGLTIYALAMMIFSITLEKFNLLTHVSLRIVYSGGQLVTAISTAIMFLFPTKVVILSLSWTIGITVSTSLTIPYVLVGKYHQDSEYVKKSPGGTKRGYGTDCAILACQMYAGNLLYAAISGPVIMAYGGVKIVILVTCLCHTVAFFFCTFTVKYPGERKFKFCSRKQRTRGEDSKL